MVEGDFNGEGSSAFQTVLVSELQAYTMVDDGTLSERRGSLA